jgi:hypothetical protein
MLKNLPEKYHPISIHLHPADIKKNKHKIYEQLGMTVLTAGGERSVDFARSLYNNLKNYKYVTSNAHCVAGLYAVEMGTPFFIYGARPVFVNQGDPNIPGIVKIEDVSEGMKVYNLFNTGPSDQITKEQSNYVKICFGDQEAIVPSKLRRILMVIFLKQFIISLLNKIKGFIRRIFKL